MVEKVPDITQILTKLKEDQPHVWETNDFVDFLGQVGQADLVNVSKNFNEYDFDWKKFLNEKPETLTKYTKDEKITGLLLQVREQLSNYYKALVEKGATLKKKKKKKITGV